VAVPQVQEIIKQVPVPQIQTIERIMEIPQIQSVEKIVEITQNEIHQKQWCWLEESVQMSAAGPGVVVGMNQ
jgi:hypothetical protein